MVERQAWENEMGPMQAVTLDLRHPWFASKAQATGRQNFHRSTTYAVPALLGRRCGNLW